VTLRVLVAAVALALVAPAPGRAEDDGPFVAWSAEAFARAKLERRIVLLAVTTTWCHWCHVMRRETYGDPRVRAVLARSFVAIRADADARPDLAERFRAYRWPTTAFLTPDGDPVLALRGHRPPADFLGVLADVEARVRRGGPYPGFVQPADGGTAVPPDVARLRALRDDLRARFDGLWDEAQAGWGGPQKYPVPEPVEHALLLARAGEPGPWRERALRTLEAERRLIDPVWGGMFQYSLGGVWTRPHFERIADVNAGAFANFTDAARLTGDARWRAAAQDVGRWLRAFLTAPDGAFFASQDAEPPAGLSGEAYFARDDAGRRRAGLPRVDRSVYARENGLWVRALASSGAPEDVAAAVRAAERVLRTHAAPGGLLLHDAAVRDGPLFLEDQVQVARGLLALDQATLDPRWRREAARLAEGVLATFRDGVRGGFLDHGPTGVAAGVLARPLRSLGPNAEAARLFLALEALTDEPRWREAALEAIAAVSSSEGLARVGRFAGALLLAVEEALLPHARVEVRGDPANPATRALVAAARAGAARWPRVFVVRGDEREPSAALVCGAASCSDPVKDPAALDAAVATAGRGG
jgi:uncharacterized protein YyaL (SSP411 family)